MYPPLSHDIHIEKRENEFILSSREAKKIAQKGDLLEIRTFLKNVGSNFVVKGKKPFCSAQVGWRVVAKTDEFSSWLGNPSPQQTFTLTLPNVIHKSKRLLP